MQVAETSVHKFPSALVEHTISISSLIAILEALLHFYIDYLKCIGKFNLLVDQILHIFCKCLWVLMI